MKMDIKHVVDGKQNYIPMLLIADQQVDMIEKYLDRGELYALYDPDLRAACVLTDEGEGVFELQNIAVEPEYQRRGYGRKLVNHLGDSSKGRAKLLMVGT